MTQTCKLLNEYRNLKEYPILGIGNDMIFSSHIIRATDVNIQPYMTKLAGMLCSTLMYMVWVHVN